MDEIRLQELDFSFVYEGEIPRGLPVSRTGFPLYPDPSIYPPDIVAGFRGWIELYLEKSEIRSRWIDPSAGRFVNSSSIREGDTREAVVALLGQPTERYEWEDSFGDKYSRDVLIVFNRDLYTVNSIGTLPTTSKKYKLWNFVFVHPEVLGPARNKDDGS